MTSAKLLIRTFNVTLLILFILSTSLWAQQAKYVFYFIGDGMGMTHVAVTEAYIAAAQRETGFTKLSFSEFPTTGVANNHALNRLITGSAAAGTALATGQKTTINTISMDGKRLNNLTSIACEARDRGFKIGIISSVSINHATPAVFYANQPTRSNYYEISLDLMKSNFNFFGGGGFNQPLGKNNDQPSAYLLAEQAGFTITRSVEEFDRLKPGDNKVIAVGSPIDGSAALRFAIDQNSEDIPLSRFIEKSIELLDNETGFFIMAEEGKIDWAAHANDGATVIQNVISLSDAVEVALEFYHQHPDETLIVVTADHETGGLSLGWAGKHYDSDFAILQLQKISSESFTILLDSLLKGPANQRYEFAMEMVNNYFGLGGETGITLSDYESELFKTAWKAMNDTTIMTEEEKYLRYGGGNPITATAVRVLNNKAGLGWTTFSHTGTPVPVFAIGQGHDMFNGYYDITDIPKKIRIAMGLNQ
ncbi:MAG: alkaline phosphatase [Bacteroidales bacterium]|nr:alkaline phosphatase [Bacteroidales bacterium]